jgi:hypothetical protein
MIALEIPKSAKRPFLPRCVREEFVLPLEAARKGRRMVRRGGRKTFPKRRKGKY